MTSKSMASSCCPSVGSSNGRSAGSTEPDASPKTSKRQSSPRSHGSSSPSPSCSRDASPGSQVNKRDFRVGLKEWYLYAARAGLLIGVANHRRDFQPQHDRPCRDWDKPARAAIVFIHNGAPSALVGCLGDLEVFQTERAMVRIAVRVLQLDLCHFRPLRYRGVGPPAVRFLPTTLLSRRKRNRLRELRGVSSSITIRSTAILSLTPMLPVSPHAHEVELLRAAPSRRAIPRAQDPTRHARRMEARRVTSRPRDSRLLRQDTPKIVQPPSVPVSRGARHRRSQISPAVMSDSAATWRTSFARLHYVSQFSTFNPRTRLNSAALAVTIVVPKLRAWAAIRRSFGPMGFPEASNSTRMLAYSASAGTSKGRTSSV